jgi:FkbM family methyltransferase
MSGSIHQFLNTLDQIRRAESTGFVRGVSRHLSWIVRRLSHNFPTTLPLSESVLYVEFHSGVQALVNCLGIYDYNNMNLIKLVLSHIKPAIFFDVGANVGAYTLVASEVSHAQVVSFEPHPRAFSCLKRNILMNKRTNVLLYPIAVSDTVGTVTFTDAQEMSINKISEDSLSGTIPVDTRRLDDICSEVGFVPNVVKVDVEGHEPNVLNGFRHRLPEVDMLLIENGDDANVVALLQSFDFQGPLYFHASSRSFRSSPQRRAEDPVFVRERFVRTLRNSGVKLVGGAGEPGDIVF